MEKELTTIQTGLAKRQDAQQTINVFADADSFSTALRMAEVLSHSTIVPKAYQGNAGNCMIAIEMAARIGTSPMMVMQNLYIVNGSPAWSSQWIIAMINNSGRYKTGLQFEFGHAEEDEGLSCRAYADDINGHRVEGPKITMKMAREEGWLNRNGSKWKTMPEVMIRYRAASFFGRANCPDMIMGIYSKEEVVDMGVVDSDYTVVSDVAAASPAKEEDRRITKDERLGLFTMARALLGSKANSVVREICTRRGIESTETLTLSGLRQIEAEIRETAESPADDSHDAGDGDSAEDGIRGET